MGLSEHRYGLTVQWTGNSGEGTSSYRGYSRDHDILIPGLPVLKGSADPTFHGDKARYNPEQLLLAALAQCHMLSYLHVAVKHGVVVTAYRDEASGMLKLNRDGSGQFESVTLRPTVTVADPAHAELAGRL
ncbi:MAG: peroxiredoxin, partial [Arthrobacter sp.]|nr:peroxiredoxin [Arthrobacter sp.]